MPEILNQGPKRNEGCTNCGREENYPGADSPNVRYLCGTCVATGLVYQGQDEFERIEAEKREAQRPVIRVTRKKKEPKKTLATC